MVTCLGDIEVLAKAACRQEGVCTRECGPTLGPRETRPPHPPLLAPPPSPGLSLCLLALCWPLLRPPFHPLSLRHCPWSLWLAA